MRVCVAILLAACGSSGAQSLDAPPGGDAASPADAAGDAPAAMCPAVTTFDPTGPELTIAGETATAGIFDPSLVAGDPMNAAVAYSSVPDQMNIRTLVAVPNVPVSTQIASSDSAECPMAHVHIQFTQRYQVERWHAAHCVRLR